VLQDPVPLQVDGGWYIPLAHPTAGPHGVVVGCCMHAPFKQKPVLPQGPLFEQRP
jgi:hypothetical protein